MSDIIQLENGPILNLAHIAVIHRYVEVSKSLTVILPSGQFHKINHVTPNDWHRLSKAAGGHGFIPAPTKGSLDEVAPVPADEDTEDDEPKASGDEMPEIQHLRDHCDALGIEYHKNHKRATLLKLIEEHKAQEAVPA